jgi:hypothetical protein
VRPAQSQRHSPSASEANISTPTHSPTALVAFGTELTPETKTSSSPIGIIAGVIGGVVGTAIAALLLALFLWHRWQSPSEIPHEMLSADNFVDEKEQYSSDYEDAMCDTDGDEDGNNTAGPPWLREGIINGEESTDFLYDE